MRYLYSLLLYLLVPWIVLRLVWRSRREGGYMQNVGERFGSYRKTAGTPLIWVHAVSVGETRAAQPLIQALFRDYPQYYVLITHMTPTGREAGRELYGGRVERCYLPYDLPGAVADFLAHYNPRAGILMETEIWPNLIHACSRRGIPLYLVNARLSKKSWAGYRRFAAGRAAHEPGHRLDDEIVSGDVRERPALAEARDRAMDEPRIDRPGARVVDAEPRRDAGPERFDRHVAPAQQALGHLLARVGREVERDAALVAVGRVEVDAAVAVAGMVVPARIADAGLLDLDHVRAQLAQHHGGERPR